jgi:hypothetical protein
VLLRIWHPNWLAVGFYSTNQPLGLRQDIA